MANADQQNKHRSVSVGALVIAPQDSNPIAEGDSGFYVSSNGQLIRVFADGSEVAIGAGAIKDPVLAATTTVLAASTYSAVALTLQANANGALGTIDGVTLAVGDRLLVQDQADAKQNGIYEITSLGSGGSKWLLTRAEDCDSSDDFIAGFLVAVQSGSTNGDNFFMLTSAPPVIMDTDNITFAGAPLSITYGDAADIADLDSGVESAGASNDVARADHKHALAAGTLSADTAGRALMAADFFNAATTDDKFAAGAIGEDLLTANELTGRVVANVADVPTTPGMLLIFPVALASGANGDVDITVAVKVRVIDFHFALKGAGTAGCLVTLKNSTNAISDAIDCAAGGDKDVFRAAELDDAQHVISAAGTLRISKASTGGDFPGAECYVLAMRVA